MGKDDDPKGGRPGDPDSPTVKLDKSDAAGKAADPWKFSGDASGSGLGSRNKVGDYTLMDKLGEGGYGDVWRAYQKEPVRREVALKILRPGVAGSKEMVARFKAEGQALALMDHPNVAKVYDAGELGDGRFYFAMELVGSSSGEDGSVKPGLPLTDFCDENRLGLRERMRLFAQVCRAIHHAHQKGVIHRDLKPSNILVGENDGRAVPKVIDFGIAKDSGAHLSQETLYTETGQLIGTPQYMSPEQASGVPGAVDTRTDVYALGAVLYELLCGQPPISRETLRSASLEEMLRIIREDEPPKPSARAVTMGGDEDTATATARGLSESRRLADTLRGEPDWIALKALEKDPGRRHQSAGDLAEDADAFVSGVPLPHSGPPSRAYRLKKFFHRNRGVVMAAAAIVFLLVAGLAVSLWQASRAMAAEAEAKGNLVLAERREAEALEAKVAAEIARAEEERARAEAEAVSDFLVQAFRSPDPTLDGRKVTVASVLENAWKLLEGRGGMNPVRRAELASALGITYGGLGLPKESIPIFEAELKMRVEAEGEDHPKTLDAKRNLARSYGEVGRYEEALEILEAAEAAARSTHGEGHRNTLISQLSLANGYWDIGRTEEALKMREELLPAMRSRLGAWDSNTLRALSHLAVSYWYAGRTGEAVALMEEGLAIRKKKFGENHPDTLSSMINLGVNYGDVGQPEKAVSMLEDAYAMCREQLGEEHPSTMLASYNLSNHYWESQRHEEALKMREQVLDARRRVLGEEHPDTLQAVNNLAVSYKFSGRDEEALEMVMDVVPKMKRVMGTKDWNVLVTMGNLPAWLNGMGRPEEALEKGKEAVAAMEAALGADDPLTLLTTLQIADSYRRMKNFDEAMKIGVPALEKMRRVTKVGNRNLLHALTDVGNIHAAVGNTGEAFKLKGEEMKLGIQLYGKMHRPNMGRMTDYGSMLKRAGKLDEALALLEESAELKRKFLPVDDKWLWVALYHLEECYRMKGRTEDAVKIQEEIKAKFK